MTSPYFLATKLEALADRGGGDYLASPDLEDIVTVIDGRPEIVEEAIRSDATLRQFLSERLSTLLSTRTFVETQPAQLPPDTASQARLPILLDRIRRIAQLHP